MAGNSCSDFIDSIELPELDEALLDEISDFRFSGCKEKITRIDENSHMIEVQEPKNLNMKNYDIDYLNDDEEFMKKEDASHDVYFKNMSADMIDIAGNGGVFKRMIKAGSFEKCPPNALCRVHYAGFIKNKLDPFDSTIIRKKPCLIKLGVGENGLPGLLLGLSTMSKGEVAQFLLSPDYAYGQLGCPPRVPANSHVMFEVELLGFVDQSSMTDFIECKENRNDFVEGRSFSDILRVANCLNKTGNDHFNNKKFKLALRSYGKSIRLVEAASLENEQDEIDYNDFLKKVFLNVAFCCLKSGQPRYALKMCFRVLEIETDNVKALFRLGQTYKCLGMIDTAHEYFVKCSHLLPNNLQVNQELKALDSEITFSLKSQENYYKKCFGASKTKADKNPTETFKDSYLYDKKVYDHFGTILRKYKESQSTKKLYIPNNFSEFELKNLEAVALSMELNYAINAGKKNIEISKM